MTGCRRLSKEQKKAKFSLKEVLKFNLTRESSTTYPTQVPDTFSSCQQKINCLYHGKKQPQTFKSSNKNVMI